jgi:hypothetical protein
MTGYVIRRKSDGRYAYANTPKFFQDIHAWAIFDSADLSRYILYQFGSADDVEVVEIEYEKLRVTSINGVDVKQ